jgi:hypothetical protein
MRGKPRSALLLTGALGAILITSWASAQGVSGVISAEQRRIKAAQDAQDQLDKIAEATRKRFDEYQTVLKEIESLKVYNGVLQSQVDDQEAQLADLRSSIENVTVVERQILPMMTRMIDGLEAFIKLDAPFYKEQRLAGVAELRDLLKRADVTTAEQFRKVMEAWQIEDDYGRFPETYTDEVEIDGVTRTVDFLKIGRVALYYVTPNNSLAGVWNQSTRDWDLLGSQDGEAIREAILTVNNMAKNGTPPETLTMLPVAPPEEN